LVKRVKSSALAAEMTMLLSLFMSYSTEYVLERIKARKFIILHKHYYENHYA